MSEELAQILLKENLELKYKIVQVQQEKEEISQSFRDYRYELLHSANKQTKMDIERNNKALQERIDKAIEYIERLEVNSIGTPYSYTERGKDLLNILKGDDNESN